jgi:hypothetical protein
VTLRSLPLRFSAERILGDKKNTKGMKERNMGKSGQEKKIHKEK